MSASDDYPMALPARAVERPWGGRGVPALGLTTPPDVTVGEWWLPTDRFPLLVKIIDARENLSIQLHPDDDLAREQGEQNGKTEAWYVLDRDPGARILIGLRDGVDPRDFLDAAERGEDVSDRLNSIEPEPGDVVFVPPGTIHAICAGVVILEVQQVSDVTYRVFDWNREPRRQLHLAESRLAVQHHADAGVVTPPTRRDSVSGDRHRMDCDKFFIADVTAAKRAVPARRADVPEMWFCRRGRGRITAGDRVVPIVPGGFYLVPASTLEVAIVPDEGDLSLVRMGPT